MLPVPNNSFSFPALRCFQNESTEILWKCRQTFRGVMMEVMRLRWKLWVMAALHIISHKCQIWWEQLILAVISTASSNVWVMVKSILMVSFNQQAFFAPSSLWTDPLILDDKYIFFQYFNHTKGSVYFKMVSDIFKHPDKLHQILKSLDLTSYPEFHNKMRVAYRLICGIFLLLWVNNNKPMSLLHQ